MDFNWQYVAIALIVLIGIALLIKAHKTHQAVAALASRVPTSPAAAPIAPAIVVSSPADQVAPTVVSLATAEHVGAVHSDLKVLGEKLGEKLDSANAEVRQRFEDLHVRLDDLHIKIDNPRNLPTSRGGTRGTGEGGSAGGVRGTGE